MPIDGRPSRGGPRSLAVGGGDTNAWRFELVQVGTVAFGTSLFAF